MKYKVIKKTNPRDPKGPKKQYASPVKAGNLTLKDLAKEIAANSSLSRGDVENVLINFVEQMPVFLKIGMSVKLGDFGTLRLSLKSEGVEEGEKFDASKIKGVKPIFTPGMELKKSLEDITFEEQK
jgi:predicted histone-like DNA-binding protein